MERSIPISVTTNPVAIAAFDAACMVESCGGGLLYLLRPFDRLMSFVEAVDKHGDEIVETVRRIYTEYRSIATT